MVEQQAKPQQSVKRVEIDQNSQFKPKELFVSKRITEIILPDGLLVKVSPTQKPVLEALLTTIGEGPISEEELEEKCSELGFNESHRRFQIKTALEDLARKMPGWKIETTRAKQKTTEDKLQSAFQLIESLENPSDTKTKAKKEENYFVEFPDGKRISIVATNERKALQLFLKNPAPTRAELKKALRKKPTDLEITDKQLNSLIGRLKISLRKEGIRYAISDNNDLGSTSEDEKKPFRFAQLKTVEIKPHEEKQPKGTSTVIPISDLVNGYDDAPMAIFGQPQIKKQEQQKNIDIEDLRLKITNAIFSVFVEDGTLNTLEKSPDQFLSLLMRGKPNTNLDTTAKEMKEDKKLILASVRKAMETLPELKELSTAQKTVLENLSIIVKRKKNLQELLNDIEKHFLPHTPPTSSPGTESPKDSSHS